MSRDRDLLESTVCFFQDGNLTREALAAAAYPTVRRFAKIAARNTGIDDEAEDVVQTLWVAFVDKIAVEYDRDKSIYPLLTTYARNLARNAKWQRQSTPSLPDVYGESDEAAATDRFGSLWSVSQEEVQDLVSRRIALDKVDAILGSPKGNPAPHNGLMAGVELVAQRTEKPADKRSALPSKQQGNPLSPEQRELVEIRHALCMTQPEFAEALNINVPRLSSWEYGRTKSVPGYYMDKARELRSMGNRPRQQGKEAFDGRQMSDILLDWAKDLRVPIDDTSALAGLLGVSEPTIRRWRENEVKPSITNLVRYHSAVQLIRKRLAAAEARGLPSSS